MSHHLATPLATQSGQLHIADLYVFDGDRGTVLVMDVNSSVTGVDIKRGFHPAGRYEFRVHIGDSEWDDLTYRLAFGEPDGQGGQELSLHALTGVEARDDSVTGTLLAQGRTGEEVAGENLRIWAGRIADPFYLDLDQLGAVHAAFREGAKLDRATWRPEHAKNTFVDTTVESIVLEVGHGDSRLPDGAALGVWCTTKLATDDGWHPVNRAGHPMMWPIFRPTDTEFSNQANFRHPAEDLREDGEAIASAVARVVAANGTASDPTAYGWSVAREVYPDLLRYRVGTPANYGFAARNGRRLADNAPEVMFSLVFNTGISTGLSPDITRDARTGSFPYVVPA